MTRRRASNIALIVLALLAVPFLWCAGGCASGPVTTSTGAVVDAPVVQGQDALADTLSMLKDAYKEAVARHDAKAGLEDAAKHAKRREQLITTNRVLKALSKGLLTWKRASGDPPPPELARDVAEAIPPFLDLAVELRVLNEKTAAATKGFLLATFQRGGAP